MANEARVYIKGLRELEKNLEMLGEQMRERGVKLMLARAAVPMRDEAKRRAPVLKEPDPRRNAGTVRNAIGIWRNRKTRLYAATYYVGVRTASSAARRKWKIAAWKAGKRSSGSFNPNDPYYWRYLEFGTSKMAARPFLRPAFEAKKMDSVRIAMEEAREFIRKTAAKMKKAA